MATLRVDDFLMDTREVCVMSCPYADCKWEYVFPGESPQMTDVIQRARHHLEASHGNA